MTLFSWLQNKHGNTVGKGAFLRGPTGFLAAALRFPYIVSELKMCGI